MDENDYYYRDIVDGVSDADSNQSSDDDTTDYRRLFDHGKHLSKEDKEILLGSNDTHVDEDSNLSFEREMEKEARNHVNGVHVDTLPVPITAKPSGSKLDIAGMGPSPASTSKTREQEDDELFYDSEEDQRDQEWLDSHRVRHVGASVDRQTTLQKSLQLKMPQSDATLNCPCCLALLCIDCQRHDTYKTQYRAMFVTNCRTEYSQKLLYRNKEEIRKQFKRSKKKQRTSARASNAKEEEENNSPSDLYYPVHCSTCNTQVALYDTEEVYHFFSVLASH